MPDLPPIEDQAVRYLLGELEGAERSDFEAHLASSPQLRAHLHTLESACTALALSAPARRPAPRVWKQIAQEIRAPQTAASPAPQTPPQPVPLPRPAWLPSWRELFWGTGWAAAAITAILWATGDPRQPTPTSPAPHASDLASTVPHSGAIPPAPSSAAPAVSPPTATPRGHAGSPAEASDQPTDPKAPLTQEEWTTLRQRLRELGTLNQSLSQQLVLPPGAARFQVFRLTPSNAPVLTITQGTSNLLAIADTTPDPASQVPTDSATLQSLLTHALARELAAATPSPSTSVPTSPTTPNANAPSTPTLTASITPSSPPSLDDDTFAVTPTPPATSVSEGSSFAVIDLPNASTTANVDGDLIPPTSIASRTPTSTPKAPDETGASNSGTGTAPTPASALGVYSSETGMGSIALVTSEGPPPGYAYQFWVVNNQAYSTISLGTTTHAGGRMVVNFSLDPNLVYSPGFLVTLEPEGGSAIPTGPVVVAPPSSSQPHPTP